MTQETRRQFRGTEGLDRLFAARTVAVIGASDDPAKISGKPLRLLRQYGFGGTVYPINPNRSTVQGIPAFKALGDVPTPVDLAIIATPASGVLQALRDCAAARVRAAVVFASGFAELGEAGRRAEAEMRAIAHAAGMRVLGPNSMGLMNFPSGLFATFSQVLEDGAGDGLRRGLGIVSQSGAVGNFLLTQALDTDIPVVKWIATGNECDIELCEVLELYCDDPQICGIVGYFEGARNGAGMKRALARARASNVPVALIKVGATEEGAAAVSSHTDAIVGDDRLYDALFRHYGVVRARSIEDLLDTSRLMPMAASVADTRVLITSVSGGIGIIMAEAAVERGLTLARLSDEGKSRLKSLLPFMTPANPLDVTAQIVQDFGLLETALNAAVADTRAGIVVNFIGRLGRQPAVLERYVNTIHALEAAFPGTLFLTAGMFEPATLRRLQEQGITAFSDPSRAIGAAASLSRFVANRLAPPAAVVDASAFVRDPIAGPLDERECLGVLADIGIPVPEHRVVRSAAEAVAAMQSLAKPVAMKVLSPDITHKSDAGGVKLGIADVPAAEAAFAEIMAAARRHAPSAEIRGVLMTPMATDFVEVVIGVKIDPQLGPALMLGLGGVMVEVLQDVAVRPAPVSPAQALSMLDELKCRQLLGRFRGRTARDLTAIAEAASRLSCFAAANAGWLRSIEINPFAVGPEGSGGRALDCVIETNPEVAA